MIKKIIVIFSMLILSVGNILACEVTFSISGEQKASYRVGEEFIIEVKVVYTHRKCEIELSDTKFKYEGLKILGATPWKEKAPATFVRQIKVMVIEDSLAEANMFLTLSRTCSKEGVLGSIKVNKSLSQPNVSQNISR